MAAPMPPEVAENICHTLYVQPQDSGWCGQYSVAHFCAVMPEESLLAFKCTGKNNKKPGTKTKDLHKALSFLGYKAPTHMRLNKDREKLPKRCILNIRWWRPGTEDHGKGHWVVYDRGFVVCSGPDQAGVYKLSEYLKDRIGVAVSYLTVDKL